MIFPGKQMWTANNHATTQRQPVLDCFCACALCVFMSVSFATTSAAMAKDDAEISFSFGARQWLMPWVYASSHPSTAAHAISFAWAPAVAGLDVRFRHSKQMLRRFIHLIRILCLFFFHPHRFYREPRSIKICIRHFPFRFSFIRNSSFWFYISEV